MRPSSWSDRSSSRGSSCGTSPTARSNSRTKTRKADSQSRSAASSVSSGLSAERRRGFALLVFEHGDDRVALADLALGDDPPEPLPVVTDREIGGPGRPAPPDAARLRDALDDPPRFGLGEGQARGAVAEPERLADLAFGERLLAGHQVGLDAGDRRGHAPGRAHLAPRLGQLDADGLGGLAGRDRRRRRGPFVACALAPPSVTCALTVACLSVITCYVRVAALVLT